MEWGGEEEWRCELKLWGLGSTWRQLPRIKKVVLGFCNLGYNSCNMFGLNITNVWFQWNPDFVFYFVIWISFIFFTFLVVLTTILARQSWKPKWYSWSAINIIETSCAVRRPERRSQSPDRSPSGFKLFSFAQYNHIVG